MRTALRLSYVIPSFMALLPGLGWAAETSHARQPAAVADGAAAALPVTAVTIDVERGARQVFSGFGASVGNWEGGYQRLPPAERERLAQALWSDNGLGFNTLRLWVNLNEFSPTPGAATIAEFRARYVDSGLVADARRQGVTTLLLAPENLPPYLAEGTADGQQLKAGAGEDYARVLAAFITQVRDQTGLVIDATGLQNEPNDKDHFTKEQLATVVKCLRRDLDAAGLREVRLIGPENSSADGLYYEWVNHLRADPEAWSALSAVASHTYNMGATDMAEQVADGKPYWMTETGDNGPEAPGDAHRAATLATRFLNDANHGVTTWIHFLGFETDDQHDNATRIIALSPDGSGWTSFRKYDYYRRLSAAFRPGAVFRRCRSSLAEGMTWTFGKKPRLVAAGARNADGTWSIGVCNYTSAAFSERGDTGTWEIDQEGRPATTCAVTVRVAELAGTGDLPLDAWRCAQDGRDAGPTRLTMHDGAITMPVAPFELVTLRGAR